MDHILRIIQALASRPREAEVKKLDGNPIILEIKVSEEDFTKVFSKQLAIEAIVKSIPEFSGKPFSLKFVEPYSQEPARMENLTP